MADRTNTDEEYVSLRRAISDEGLRDCCDERPEKQRERIRRWVLSPMFCTAFALGIVIAVVSVSREEMLLPSSSGSGSVEKALPTEPIAGDVEPIVRDVSPPEMGEREEDTRASRIGKREKDVGLANMRKGGVPVHEKAKGRKNHPVRLEELVKGGKVRGNVDWMIDFAVVGFPKCGTSFLLHYFAKQPGISMPDAEWCNLSNDRADKVVTKLYRGAPPPGADVVRGIKCPREMESEFGLENYAKHFKRTNFIISLRHPVSWFESFHNFKTFHNLWHTESPPTAEDLIGECEKGSPFVRPGFNICTDRTKFHHALSRLGKTDMLDDEKRLLKHSMSIVPRDNKIFLMEVGQLNENNTTLSERLRAELRDFLGSKHELAPLVHKSHKPRNYFDICQEKHTRVRSILLQNGKDAAEWIREYFLKSPDVIVPNKEHFLELLKNWERDPCEGRIK